MATSIDSTHIADRSQPVWLRRLLTTLSIIAVLLTLPLVMGTLVPGIPFLGDVGTVCESFFSLHIVLMAGAGLTFALVAKRLGGKKTATTGAVLNAITTLGALVPLITVVLAAQRYDAPISWLDHLHVTAAEKAVPDKSELYATLDGRKLYVDIYLPAKGAAASPTIFAMHGGGFIMGARSDARNWDRWFAQRGYAVFDVDYRLAPPLTWNTAAQDVVCAMAWVQAHADTLHVATDRILMTGQSAGASLALQVGYGLGDGTVTSSCGGSVSQPSTVVAMYPAEDLILAWNKNTRIGPLRVRDALAAYIGGTPEEFPDRYRATSSIFHIRPGLPATFLAYGEHDHLVPESGHIDLAAKLTEAGVKNVVMTIPFYDHGYDVFWGGIGTQITRHVLGEFLDRHFPVLAPAASP